MATLQRDEKRIAGRQISATAIHIFDWYRTPEATQLNDGADVPDTLQITYQYPGFILSYEASMLNGYGLGAHGVGRKYYGARGPDDRPHGMAFYGTNASLFADRVGFELYPEPKGSSLPGLGSNSNHAEGWRTARVEATGEDATELHVKNFIDCVRSREKPVADIETGHRSTIVPHFESISIRTGHKLRWDASKEQIADDREASALLSDNRASLGMKSSKPKPSSGRVPR